MGGRNRRVALATICAAAALVLAVVYAARGDGPPPREVATGGIATLLPSFGAAQQTDPDGVVFDLETIRVYDLSLSEESLAKLNADPLAERYVPGSVSVDGETYANIGIRYKGYFGVLRQCFFTGENTCAKLAWKLKFSHYEPNQRYHGLKRLNFHPMSGDDAQMREILTYRTFRESGVVAPRSVYAELRLNGELLGLFTLTEDIDDRFIADRFGDTGLGVLYKEIWPSDLSILPSLVERLDQTIARGPNDDSGLRAFEADLQAARSADDPATVYAVLDTYIEDLDVVYRYLAADRLSDNWDGIVAWYCTPECFNHNFFWYERPRSDTFILIPWDVEQSWRGSSPIREYYGMPDWDELERGCETVTVFWQIEGRPPYCDPILHALATQGWARYIEASRVLIEDLVPLPTLREQVRTLAALIDGRVRADPNGPGYRAWQEAVRALDWEIEQRYQYIADKIAAWDANGMAPASG